MGIAEVFSAPAAKRVCPLTTQEVVDKVLVFVNAMGQRDLYTYQSLFCQRIIESVILRDGRTTTGLWARQSGKTESIACVVIALAIILPALAKAFPDDTRFMRFAKGFWAGVYAPVKEQSDISFSRMREKMRSDEGKAILADPEIDVFIIGNRADSMTFSNGSYIFSRTASPDSQIEGKTYHLVILEEAQKILPTKVEKEIRPMLTSTFGSMIMIGTAWESRGGFHREIQKNQERFNVDGVRSHFEFPYDIVVAEKQRSFERTGDVSHTDYERSLQELFIRLGGEQEARRNSEFQMNYMCLWRESRIIAINPVVFARAAILDDDRGPRRSLVQVAGLDVGKVLDYTVLTIGEVDTANPVQNTITLAGADQEKQIYYPKKIVDWLELQGAFEGYTGQYAKLVSFLAMFNVQILVIDATSKDGDAVFERIQAMVGDSIVCVPFKFGSLTKSLLYKYYLQEVHSGRMTYVAGPETRGSQEYSKFQYEHENLDKLDKGGYTVCEAQEGEHDDYPDSAALMCHAERLLNDARMPEIQFSSGPEVGRSGWRNNGGTAEVESSGQGQSTMFGMVGESRNSRHARYQRRW